MEFNQILELIDHVSASELTAFTYETADLTLSMEHGKPQIIQGVMGETVENIPAAGMAGGKVRRAVHTVPMAGAGSVAATVSDPADECSRNTGRAEYSTCAKYRAAGKRITEIR